MRKCRSSTDIIGYVLSESPWYVNSIARHLFQCFLFLMKSYVCTKPRQEGVTQGVHLSNVPTEYSALNHADEHNTRLLTAQEEEKVNRGAYLEWAPVSFARGPAPDFTRLCSTHMSKTCSIGTANRCVAS